jgi:hypothetical protein
MIEAKHVAKRLGMTESQVYKLSRLLKKYYAQEVKAANGDPHPRNPKPLDKDANAERWNSDAEKTAAQIETAAILYGLEVNFANPYPYFKKGNDDHIFIPDDLKKPKTQLV